MKIQLKRSNVLNGSVAKAPTSTQMEFGELAVNYNNGDPTIFIKTDDATAGVANDGIIRIAGKGAFGVGTGDITLTAGTGLTGGGAFELDQTNNQTITFTLAAASSSSIGGITEPSSAGNYARTNAGAWSLIDYATSGTNSTIANNAAVGGNLSVTGTITGDLTGDVTGDVTGNLTGTSSLASQVTVVADNTSNQTVYPVFSQGATGSQALKSDSG